MIGKIFYTERFIKRLKKLPPEIIDLACEKESLFKENPLHPSLRLHGLKGKMRGYWSISVNERCRIIFRRLDSGDILFISIGNHDIYRHF